MKVLLKQIISPLIITLFCVPSIGYAIKNNFPKHDSDSFGHTSPLLLNTDSLKAEKSSLQQETLLKKVSTQERPDSILKAKRLARLNALSFDSVGYPVSPFSDTLFMLYTRIGSFSAAERAASISSRIEKLYDDYEFQPDSLDVTNNDNSAEIVYKDLVIMSVNELEALLHNKRPDELAFDYRDKIKNAIQEEREANSILNIVLRIAAVFLIIAGLYVVIQLNNKLFKKINVRITKLKDNILKGIRFRGYQFLDSERELQVALFLVKILRLLIITITLYIALPLMFSVFPWTRGIAEKLIGWIITPLKNVFFGFLNYLPNLFTIIVIGAVTHYVIRFLKLIATEIECGALTLPGFYPDWAKPTMNIIKFLLYAFSFIIIFPYLPGSDSPIFQGVSVFLGILFSFGSSSAISNVVAGLVITYMRPFKVGDRIKIGEISGDVIEKTLLVTRIRTIKNEYITLPNAAILSGHTINYTTSAKELGLILHTGVTIGYDVPWKQVHELLIKAAMDTNAIMKDNDHRPFVLQTSLDDFYVSYQLNAYTDEPGQMAKVYSELHQNIQDKFNDAGVEIMSPHYRAERDGNTAAIPSQYLPDANKGPLDQK